MVSEDMCGCGGWGRGEQGDGGEEEWEAVKRKEEKNRVLYDGASSKHVVGLWRIKECEKVEEEREKGKEGGEGEDGI